MQYFSNFFAKPDEIKKHNTEVQKIWEAYNNDRPIRVPVTSIGGQVFIYDFLEKTRSSFKEYYLNPEVMMETQAKCHYINGNIILSDDPVYQPERWPLLLDYHPFNDEAYWGCEVVYTDDNQPKIKHLYEEEKVDPDSISIPDPFDSPFMKLVTDTFKTMKKLSRKKLFHGNPFDHNVDVDRIRNTYGIFSTAIQLRGINLFSDFHEDPQYVEKLLNKVAEGYVVRNLAWKKYDHLADKRLISIIHDHGTDMLSINHFEEFLVPVYRKLKELFGADSFNGGCIEHCGKGEHIIRYQHKHFGIKNFINLHAGYLDIEKLRHDLGDEVWLSINLHPEILLSGPPERIHKAVKELLTPRVKGKGRLTFGVQGYYLPLEHKRAVYDAVREYGYY